MKLSSLLTGSGHEGLVLTLVAAQSIQPLPLGSMFINTSPSTKSGKMSCRVRRKANQAV